MQYAPYEDGGITGGAQAQLIKKLQGVEAPPLQADTPAPVAAPLGTNKLTGFDMNKFADPNRSEKYKIGDVFSRYDPKGGVTPEMLKELNALGIAEFSGQGQDLTVNNTKNDPRFGKGGTSDVIKGLKGNNADTAWQPWFVDDQPQGQAMPQQGGGSPMSLLTGMLGGGESAQGNIQSALGKLNQPGLLQQLIAQLQGQA